MSPYRKRMTKLEVLLLEFQKTISLVTRPVNKLYPIECMNESNKLGQITLNKERLKREAAIKGDIKRRFTEH